MLDTKIYETRSPRIQEYLLDCFKLKEAECPMNICMLPDGSGILLQDAEGRGEVGIAFEDIEAIEEYIRYAKDRCRYLQNNSE